MLSAEILLSRYSQLLRQGDWQRITRDAAGFLESLKQGFAYAVRFVRHQRRIALRRNVILRWIGMCIPTVKF